MDPNSKAAASHAKFSSKGLVCRDLPAQPPSVIGPCLLAEACPRKGEFELEHGDMMNSGCFILFKACAWL